MIPPFKWLYTFMNRPGEWHAFAEGIADGFCMGQDRYKPWDEGEGDENLFTNLRKEHHYYNTGRFTGRMIFIILITGMVAWILNIIL